MLVRLNSMRRDLAATCIAVCLTVGACAQDQPEPDKPSAPATNTAAAVDLLESDMLGPVQYAYDPRALTRAEISLPLPPDFTQSAFAIKFIPAQLLANLGDPKCSNQHDADASECTAEEEIGLAIAYLERPIDTYRKAVFNRLDDNLIVTPANVRGHEGFTLETTRGGAALRYTFLPVEGRTLLLAERGRAEITTGAAALGQVRESLRFPDE